MIYNSNRSYSRWRSSSNSRDCCSVHSEMAAAGSSDAKAATGR